MDTIFDAVARLQRTDLAANNEDSMYENILIRNDSNFQHRPMVNDDARGIPCRCEGAVEYLSTPPYQQNTRGLCHVTPLCTLSRHVRTHISPKHRRGFHEYSPGSVLISPTTHLPCATTNFSFKRVAKQNLNHVRMTLHLTCGSITKKNPTDLQKDIIV